MAVLEFAREELCVSVAEAPIGIRVGDDGDNDVILFDTARLQFLNKLCVQRGLLRLGSCLLVIPMKTTFFVRSIPSPVS